MRRIYIVLAYIAFANGWGLGVKSGNQVAQHLSHDWSRATTYRLLEQCEIMNLATREKTERGHKWELTLVGKRFMNQWERLKGLHHENLQN